MTLLGGSALMESVEMYNNTATVYGGGALYIERSTDWQTSTIDLQMKNVKCYNNYALYGNGGCIHLGNAIFLMYDCQIYANYAYNGNGGAIYMNSDALSFLNDQNKMTKLIFYENVGINGAAIYANGVNFGISKSEIASNVTGL